MLLGPPEKVGRYAIREEIGAGGFATVYRAHDPALDREVALKVLHRHLARDPAIRDRFVREGRALARIHHANVVQVHDAGEVDGVTYLAMELIEGEALGALLRRRGRLSLWETVQVVEQAASGLAALHDHGLLHLDVKPPNILIERGTARVVLLDLGVARGIEETISLTGSASFGTPAYMAPEQFLAGGRLSPATDVYQLGATAFVLLTGSPPFPGTAVEVMESVRHAPPPDPAAVVPGLSRAAGRLVQRALAKDPTARPATPLAFAAGLRGLSDAAAAAGAGDPIVPPPLPAPEIETAVMMPPSSTEQVTTVSSRRSGSRSGARDSRLLRPAWLAGLVALAVLAVTAWMVGVQGRGSGRQEDGGAPAPIALDLGAATSLPAAAPATPTPAPTASPTPAPSAAPTPRASPPATRADFTPPPSPAPAGAGELLAAAMTSRGFAPVGDVVQVSTDGGDTLSVQKGVCGGAANGLCQMLFIALNDRFLGTDWPEPSLVILDVQPAGAGRFAARYGQYREGDIACCPRGEAVTVTFTWNGSRLRPDRIAPGQCQNGC